MKDQSKTPGAMVQITHEQLRDLVAGYCGQSALGDLYALADAPAEQTPAVGGEFSSTIMRIAAELVCEKPLRDLYSLCENQSRVSSAKLHGLLECAGDMMKQTGIDIRRAIDKDRQARPATAKMALPEPVDIEKPRTQPNSWDDHGMGWNACLDEIAKLNP